MSAFTLLDLWTPWKGKGYKIFNFPAFLLHAHLLKQSGSCLLLHGSSTTVLPDRRTVPLPSRITEQLRLEGNSEAHFTTHCEVSFAYFTFRSGCSGLCPVEFWASPRMKIPHPVCATCFRALTNFMEKCFLIANWTEFFHGATCPFMVHILILSTASCYTAGNSKRTPLSLLYCRLKPALDITICSSPQPSWWPFRKLTPRAECLVWGSPTLRSRELNRGSHFPWCAGYVGSNAAQYVLTLHCCSAQRSLFLQALQILSGNYSCKGGYEGLLGRGRYLPSRSLHKEQTTILSWACFFMYLTFLQRINILTC